MVLTGVGPCDGTRGSVASGHRPVDADLDTRLVSVVGTRELDSGGGGASTAASDLELSTSDVELSASKVAGAMETDVLSAHEVLTSGQVGWQSEGEVGDTAVDEAGPLNAVGGESGVGKLVDLEPVAVSLVFLSSAGSLAHVNGQGTRVAKVGVDLEANLITGCDGVSLSLGHYGGIKTTSVANDVV